MISFKDFLIESRSAPLYHGTAYDNAIRILNNNILTVSNYSDVNRGHPLFGKLTISMTRSRNFAEYWGKRKSDWTWDNKPTASIVFELDRGKLKNTHKLIPYNHFGYNGARLIHTRRWLDHSTPPRPGTEHRQIDANQYEERTDKSIRNVDRYITALYMDRETLDKFSKEKIYDEYKDRVKVV